MSEQQPHPPVREGGVKVATGSNYKKVKQLDQ